MIDLLLASTLATKTPNFDFIQSAPMMQVQSGSSLTKEEKQGIVFILLVILGVYFLPTLISAIRLRDTTPSLFVINLFLGLRLWVWVMCLAYAIMPKGSRSLPYIRRY